MQLERERGFNLLELMVTVFVLAIVLGLGIPNLIRFVDENQMAGATNDLLTGLHLARSEAVKRQRVVTLCNSLDPAAAPLPSCDAGNLGGWIVFEDTNANAALDAGEPVVQAQPASTPDVTINSDGAYIAYAASGFRTDIGATPSVSTVLLCDSRGLGSDPNLSLARLIRVDTTGRPQVLRNPGDVQGAAAALGVNLATDCP